MRTIYGNLPPALMQKYPCASSEIEADVIVWGGCYDDVNVVREVNWAFRRPSYRFNDVSGGRYQKIFVALKDCNSPIQDFCAYSDHTLSCIVSSVSELETYLEMLCE